MKTCVIFTDTERLARKYSVTQSTVMEMISRNLLLRGDFDFQLLDAADYGPELKAMSTWEGYKEILIDFFLGMGIEQFRVYYRRRRCDSDATSGESDCRGRND